MSENIFYNYLKEINEKKDFSHFLDFLSNNKIFIYENNINTGSYTPRTNLIGYAIYKNALEFLNEIEKKFPEEFRIGMEKVENDLIKLYPFIFYNGDNIARKNNNIGNVIELLKNMKKEDLIKSLFLNESFLKSLSLDNSLKFMDYIEGILNVKDIINVKEKNDESVFLKQFRYSKEKINDLSFLNLIIESLNNVRKNSVVLSEREVFIKNLCGYSINEKTALFLKEKQLQTSGEISLTILCKFIENENISSPIFLDIFKNEIEDLIKNQKDELVSLIHHSMMIGKEGIALPILKNNPHLLYMNNMYTDKTIWQLFFDRSELREASVYLPKNELDFIFIERNNVEQYKESMLFQFILKEVEVFTQDDVNKILSSSIALKNIENFKTLFYKIKENNLEISDMKNIFKNVKDFEIVSFLKSEFSELKEAVCIVMNENFIDYMKSIDDFSEKNKLVAFYLLYYSGSGNRKDSEDFLTEINELIPLLKKIDLDLYHHSGGDFINIFLDAMHQFKKENLMSRPMNDIYIKENGTYISQEDLFKKIENDMYDLIKDISFEKLTNNNSNSHTSIINTLLKKGSVSFLEILIKENISIFPMDKETISIINERNEKSPVEMVNINTMLLKKSINLDLNDEKENIVRKRI